MTIKIPKKNIIEYLVYMMFYLLPFTFFLNKLVFNDLKVFDIGVINLIFDFIILIVMLNSIFSSKKYSNVSHVWILYILFIILNIFKIMYQTNGFSAFVEVLPTRLYYYLLPLVYIMLRNNKLDLTKISNKLIKSTIIICPISIYMFITSNYFGMVEKKLLLVYDIVGLPFSRMFSIFGSPLVAGTFFTIILLLMIYENRLKTFKDKLLFILNFICMILTFSRTAFIVFFIAIIFRYILSNKLKRENKLFILISLFIISILIILISSSNGVYFWNSKDFFNNVRFNKWISSFSVIKDYILFGSEFSLHISSSNTVATTLSDNSFLLFLGYYGIILTMLFALFCIYRYKMRNKIVRKNMFPIICCIITFCFFYDFIQLFPSNYMLVFFYIYMDKKYRDEIENNMSISNTK